MTSPLDRTRALLSRRARISLVVVSLFGCLSIVTSSGAQSAEGAPWDPRAGS